MDSMRNPPGFSRLATVLAALTMLTGCSTSSNPAPVTAAPTQEPPAASGGNQELAQPRHPVLADGERGTLVAYRDGQSGREEVAVFTPSREVVTVRVRCEGHGTVRVSNTASNGIMTSSEWECADHRERDYYDTGFQAAAWGENTVEVEAEQGIRWAASVFERTPEEAGVPPVAEEQAADEQREQGFIELLEQLELTEEEFYEILDRDSLPFEG